MWRRSGCARLTGLGGDLGGALGECVPLGGGGAGLVARLFVRVGACADELRLMGVTLAVYVADRGVFGGG